MSGGLVDTDRTYSHDGRQGRRAGLIGVPAAGAHSRFNTRGRAVTTEIGAKCGK
jgi:hypothetical protein